MLFASGDNVSLFNLLPGFVYIYIFSLILECVILNSVKSQNGKEVLNLFTSNDNR